MTRNRSGLDTLKAALRQAKDEDIDTLVEDLQMAELAWTLMYEDDAGLNGATVAVGAVAKFLHKIGMPPYLIEPLQGACAALFDVQRGATPPMLQRNRKRGRPHRGSGMHLIMAQASAAMRLYMDSGFDREEAARKVVRSINRWPVETEKKPRWTTVDDWRRELEIGTGAKPAALVFSRLLEGLRQMDVPSEQAAKQLLRHPIGRPPKISD